MAKQQVLILLSVLLAVHGYSETQLLKASNLGTDDEFGFAVALSADTIAVSSRYEDSCTAPNTKDDDCSNAGAVYVFVRSSAGWSQQVLRAQSCVLRASVTPTRLATCIYQTKTLRSQIDAQASLKASNIEPDDRFGEAIALDGDTLAVGATWEDSCSPADPSLDTCSKSGAVYVFVRSGASWSQQVLRAQPLHCAHASHEPVPRLASTNNKHLLRSQMDAGFLEGPQRRRC